MQSFGGETLKETDHLGDPDVDGRITKKKMDLDRHESGFGGMDWVNLAQDRDSDGHL